MENNASVFFRFLKTDGNVDGKTCLGRTSCRTKDNNQGQQRTGQIDMVVILHDRLVKLIGTCWDYP